MNRKKNSVEEKKTPVKVKKQSAFSARYIKYLNVFGIMSKDMLVKVMPYIFFLTLIALIYIGNSYYSERTIRDIDAIGKELKTLRTEYITGKSELMMICKQSEVARAIAPQEIKESVEAPKKIIVASQNKKSSD